jgi:hypothetical protein
MEKTMDVKLEVRLRVPTPPNYISLDIPGLVGNDSPRVQVASLTEEQKDWLAAEWRKALDVVAERQKASPEPVYRSLSSPPPPTV